MCVVNVNNMEAKEAYANWLLDTKKIVNRTKVSFFMDMANFSSKSLLHFVNRMPSACVIVGPSLLSSLAYTVGTVQLFFVPILCSTKLMSDKRNVFESRLANQSVILQLVGSGRS